MIATALGAWVVTALITRSMDDTATGMTAMRGATMSDVTVADAASFAGAWTAMMVAMMLPSALPVLRLHRRLAGAGPSTFTFAGGYLVVWVALGAVAYLIVALLRGDLIAMHELSALARPAAASALAVAAAYHCLPIQNACLRHCRSPLGFLMRRRSAGWIGAARTGAAHAALCVGCCAGLMLVLLALGVMNVTVMGAVALVIVATKTAPFGDALNRALPAALGVAAVAVALDPTVYAWLT